MTLAILSVPMARGRGWIASRPTVSARFAGGGEQRASSLSRALRRYTVPAVLDETQHGDLITFFEARGWSQESFLWKDPGALGHTTDAARHYSRVSVALTQVAGAVYTLPLTGIEGGDYPINDTGLVTLYDAGSPVGLASIQTDDRTLTYSSAPGGAATADYHYYRRVKLVPGSFRDDFGGQVLVEFELQEVAID